PRIPRKRRSVRDPAPPAFRRRGGSLPSDTRPRIWRSRRRTSKPRRARLRRDARATPEPGRRDRPSSGSPVEVCAKWFDARTWPVLEIKTAIGQVETLVADWEVRNGLPTHCERQSGPVMKRWIHNLIPAEPPAVIREPHVTGFSAPAFHQ